MPLNHSSQYAELTDEHYKAIGKIVVEWANIEFLLAVLLSRLLVTPEFLARSYTDHISAVKLQDAIKEGVEIHKQRYGCKLITKEEQDEIILINNQITELRAVRNKFAHFCWTRSSDEEIFGTNLSGGVPTSKKHKRGNVTFTVSELSKFHKKAYEIVELLSSLTQRLPQMSEDDLTRHSTGLASGSRG